VKVPDVAPGGERAAYDKAQAEYKEAHAKYLAMKAAGGNDPGYGAAVKANNRLEKVAQALRAQVPEFNLGGQEPKKALPAWGPAKS